MLVYGFAASTCTQRVLTTAKLLGIEDKIQCTGGPGFNKDPEYIKTKQPFGQMPYLDDDGFGVYESRAICFYLASKYGNGTDLIPDPKDIEASTKYQIATSIEAFDFDPYASKIASELVFKPLFHKLPTDEKAVTAAESMLDTRLQALDTILGKQKYLAGDKLTLVDVFTLPYGTMAKDLGKAKGLTEYPNVARWWSEISGLEAWKWTTEEAEKFKAASKK